MFAQNFAGLIQFVPGESGVFREQHRVEPKLCRVARFAGVDMRRLIAIGAKKAEAITLNSQHGWHLII